MSQLVKSRKNARARCAVAAPVAAQVDSADYRDAASTLKAYLERLAAGRDAGTQQERSLSYRPDMMLVAECTQTGLAVNGLFDDRFTRDRVWGMAESRLRAARLYDDSFGANVRSYLYVSVFRNAFAYTGGIELSMAHPYHGPADGLKWTWSPVPELGFHNGDAGFIMQRLTERADVLIGDYLRVNAEACE